MKYLTAWKRLTLFNFVDMDILFLMKTLTRLYEFWTRLSSIKFILFSVILILLFTIPFAVLFGIMEINEEEIGGPEVEKYGIGGAIFFVMILGPMIETLIGQAIPIKIIQRFVKWNTNRIAIIVSSLFFALGHASYSIWYFLLILPMGFVLAVTFITFQQRKESSFWMTTLVHSLRNSLAVILIFGDSLD